MQAMYICIPRDKGPSTTEKSSRQKSKQRITSYELVHLPYLFIGVAQASSRKQGLLEKYLNKS